MAKEESARELGNQAEAETFAAKIGSMLMEYELEIDDIRSRTAESIEIFKEVTETEPLTVRHESNWVVHLYNACAKTNFCRVFTNGGATSTVITIVGTKMNLEFLHFMVTYLVPRIRTLARKAFSDYHGPEKRNTYIRGWLKGCCWGIKDRLEKERMLEADNSAQISGLVLMKDKAVEDFVASNMNVGRAKSTSMKSRDGVTHGADYGSSKMDLSIKKTRGPGGTKLLGS